MSEFLKQEAAATQVPPSRPSGTEWEADMQDLYGQYGRGPDGRGQALMPRKRGFGMPVVLASGATAMALAGFFVIAALGRHEAAEPLPPKSTPLEVVKGPTEAVTGSLPVALRPVTPPVERPAITAETQPPRPAPPTAVPPRTAPTPLIQAAAPPPAPPAPTVVASAEVSTTLPSPIPPLTAPIAPPLAAAPAPVATAPEPPAAPVSKPRTGPSQDEIATLTTRAQDLIQMGDIAGARLLLERAAMGDDGPSLLALAETYDPTVLNRLGVIGVRADVKKARALYQKAADQGVAAAKDRVLALR
jgi:hypothetical protein